MLSAPSTVVVCAPPGADDSNPPADNETTARTAGGVLSALSDREIACIVVTAASPDGDGLDTLEAVGERPPNVPVVVAAPDGSERLATARPSAAYTARTPNRTPCVLSRL